MKLLSFLTAFLLSFPNLRASQQLSAPASSSSSQATTMPTTKPPQRDPQALGVLNQVLATSGGVTAFTAIQDFTASGTVTYFWAGEEVKGSVNLRGRGTDQFRIDASLPHGIRSWAVSNGTGSIKEMDGTSQPISYYNATNLGSLTFPYFAIMAALQDSTTSVADLGLMQVDGRQVRQIHTRRQLDALNDTQAIFSELATRDYFIDPTTYQLLKVEDMAHPAQSLTENYQHEISFSDYRLVGGVLVPFTISETIAGQQTWTIQLNQISFNTGLTDSDFQI